MEVCGIIQGEARLAPLPGFGGGAWGSPQGSRPTSTYKEGEVMDAMLKNNAVHIGFNVLWVLAQLAAQVGFHPDAQTQGIAATVLALLNILFHTQEGK